MKANELRLNNYVKAFRTYWQIDNTDFSNLEKIETYEFIPLTEEIILKCGFELYYESQFCKRYELLPNTEICYAFSNVEDYKGAVGFSYAGKVIQNIKYLHQLQNIYFALTGEDLEINL